MDNNDLGRSADADGLSSLRDPAPAGLAHSASIPSAVADMSIRLCGCAVVLAGAALFGGVFDFIDAHRDLPAYQMMPVIMGASIAAMFVICFGAAMVMSGLNASAIETRSAETAGLGPKDESAAPTADAQGGDL